MHWQERGILSSVLFFSRSLLPVFSRPLFLSTWTHLLLIASIVLFSDDSFCSCPTSFKRRLLHLFSSFRPPKSPPSVWVFSLSHSKRLAAHQWSISSDPRRPSGLCFFLFPADQSESAGHLFSYFTSRKGKRRIYKKIVIILHRPAVYFLTMQMIVFQACFFPTIWRRWYRKQQLITNYWKL